MGSSTGNEHNYPAKLITSARPEIVEGLMREQQIVAVGGAFGVGKSPWLQELAFCRAYGLPWCGRRVAQGPVILFDFESQYSTICRNIVNLCKRHNLSLQIPTELEIYAEIGDPLRNLNTAELLQAIKRARGWALVESTLERRPTALVIIDPPEILFRFKKRFGESVIELYTEFRFLLSKFPHALIINTFNLRKRDKRTRKSSLLSEPRDWLEEIGGSLDLLNRSDVRLGMDFYGEGARVVNGVRRGEDLHPLLIRPVYADDDVEQPAGFELVSPGEVNLMSALSERLMGYWQKLSDEFTFEQAVAIMGKSNFDRLKKRTTSLGLLEQIGRGHYKKLTTSKNSERKPISPCPSEAESPGLRSQRMGQTG
jgi:AAA domain